MKCKKAFILLLIIIIIIAAIAIAERITGSTGYIHPEYDKADITGILAKEVLSDDDYRELFYQTGLGKIAVDEILKDEVSGKEKILKFQEDFFKECNVLTEKQALIVNYEYIVDEEGQTMHWFDLAPYENGYVIVTRSTHTLGWRHGHAGIVTDADKQEVLEALLLGSDSTLQSINGWRSRPSFIMLKLKDAPEETLDEIAEYAKNNMLDVPYSLMVGLTSKKNPEPENIKHTHCSHIVWYPFMRFGYDVDSNGGWLVTPKDIANSDLFEVVQIYGVDPAEIWP